MSLSQCPALLLYAVTEFRNLILDILDVCCEILIYATEDLACLVLQSVHRVSKYAGCLHGKLCFTASASAD